MLPLIIALSQLPALVATSGGIAQFAGCGVTLNCAFVTPADAMEPKVAGLKLYEHAENDAESVTALLGMVKVHDGLVPQPRELLDHVENANSGSGVARIVTCDPCARVDVPVGEVVPPALVVTVRLNVGVLARTKFATKLTGCVGIANVQEVPADAQGENPDQLSKT